MKITHNKIGQKLDLVDSSKLDKAQDTKSSGLKNIKQEASLFGGAEATRVDVSSQAQDAKRIKDLAMKAPDIDMQKVEKFRQLIDAGQYKVDAKSVADRMVDEHLQLKQATEGSN
ncbi:MAG: flagellar biosynthesis anti-sigma factor FlgM [Bdellovibrionales bacterium]